MVGCWVGGFKFTPCRLVDEGLPPGAVPGETETLREVDPDEVTAQEEELRSEAAVLTSRGGVRGRLVFPRLL